MMMKTPRIIIIKSLATYKRTTKKRNITSKIQLKGILRRNKYMKKLSLYSRNSTFPLTT